MKKTISILTIVLAVLMLCPTAYGQNPFKKLGDKVKKGVEKIGGKNQDDQSEESSDSAEVSEEASAGAGGGVVGDQEANEQETYKEEAEEPVVSAPPAGTNNPKTASGPDESLFEDKNFSNIPITDRGVSGKGPFRTESGIITYEKEVQNAHMTSTIYDTLYFDGYGWRQARHTRQIQEVSMMGMHNRQESYTIGIIIGDTLKSYDPVKRTGTIMKNPGSEIMYEMSEAEKEQFAKEISEGFEHEREVLGTDLITGKRCEVSDNTSNVNGLETKSRIWAYKDIVLKMISSGMDTFLQELATSFQEGVSIPGKRFQVPNDIQLFNYSGFGKP